MFSDVNLGEDWSYKDQVILAPMVRIGTLPMRVLSAQQGATMVYSEELIDQKIVKTTRSVNERLGTIDYRDSKGHVVFQKVPNERVVLQIGSANPVLALKAAEHVFRDVRAIDINMGCPKSFSVHGGMGSALLSEPEKIRDILSTLRRNLNIPVTCKIRLLESQQQTLELCRIIEKSGSMALGVHARHIGDRSRYRSMAHRVRDIVDAVNIPVIHNADVFYHSDIAALKEITNAHSVMVARGAQWNPSVFNPNGMLPVFDMMMQYVNLAKQYENHFSNTKYTLCKMQSTHVKGAASHLIARSKTLEQLEVAMQKLELQPALCRSGSEYRVPHPLLQRSEMAPRAGETEPMIGSLEEMSLKRQALGAEPLKMTASSGGNPPLQTDHGDCPLSKYSGDLSPQRKRPKLLE